MMNKLGLIIVSVILALIQTGCAEPVSYTHLDVYKRQEWSNTKINSFRIL